MNLIDKFFCKHRHSIDAHPNCFAVGNVKQDQADKIAEQFGMPWYQVEGLKIGYLDIETDGLRVDFSTMLSWCIKTKDGGILSDVITKEELFNGDTDKRIVKSLTNAMKQYKIIVTYYGTNFDVPYVRAKCLHYGYEFPAYHNEAFVTKAGETKIKTVPTLCHFDLYFTVKSKLACMSSKRLATVCEYLGIEGKTPLKASVWTRAKYGDPEALDEVVKHNIGDVIILEELHNVLEPFAKWTRRGA